MKIYTGNFANTKKYIAAGMQPVSIARFARYFSGPSMKELAPTPEMLKDTEDVYTKKFDIILSKLDPQEVYNKLETLSNGKDVVMLCYEKVGDWCHRHMVASWLIKNLNIEIIELGTMQNTCC